MPDNLGYTPGSGATVATDEVGGLHYQRVKPVISDDGVAPVDVSANNPMPVQVLGEAIEAIESMRMTLQILNRTIGSMQPDTAARMRVAIDAITAGLTLATVTTVSTVTTVTTVSTLTNQSQLGGFAANDQIPALMAMRANDLRSNISVT